MWCYNAKVGVVIDNINEYKEIRDFIYILYLLRLDSFLPRTEYKSGIRFQSRKKLSYISLTHKNLNFEVFVKKVYIGIGMKNPNTPLNEFKDYVISELGKITEPKFSRDDMAIYVNGY